MNIAPHKPAALALALGLATAGFAIAQDAPTTAQQKELDVLRLTAAEHHALQGRWAEDAQALEDARAELVNSRTEAIKERERREQAEADALRAGVRLETLEQLLAQLKPDQAAADTASGGKGRGRGQPR